ncbi:MAG: DUF4430 domain-containing protein [Candidatus Magasanikbacteria bacterium]|jgi:hypothetical protein
MQNKHLVRLFFILTFLFLSTGAYLLLPDKPNIETPKPTPQNITWTDVTTNTIISDNQPAQTLVTESNQPLDNEKIEKTNVENEIKSTTTVETINKEEIKYPLNVTIKIIDKLYTLNLPENSTGYNAMQKLITDKKISAIFKEYKGVGYFLEEIDGQKNNNQTGEYWIYYINGQPAKIGISSYILKNNDLITWKYEHSKF